MSTPPDVNKLLETSYMKSLGSFIDLFSIVENLVKRLMAHFAGVDEPTALALFSGVRTDQAIANIRRLHQARKAELDPALDAALQQMAVITNFRNDLLHHRVDFTKTPPVTTNRAVVLSENAVRETVIGPDTLMDAGHDLGRIILILGVFLSDTRDGADLEWALSEPWRHKPPSQPRKHLRPIED